jgi:hypothetical protein
MTTSAQTTAFDPAAPADERQEATSELQQSFMPRALSDLMPQDAVADVINHINQGYEDAAFLKAMNPNIVPFPGRRSVAGERGMQSVLLDEWQLSVQGDYWERPSAMGFDSLRAMVEQTPVLNAVSLTRQRQVARFCRMAESGTDAPGFEIRLADRRAEMSPSERESVELLGKFVMNCGWEFKPRRRKALRRDAFSQFAMKVVRDSLAMDSVGIETEWKRDKHLGIDGFYCVDGATIRLCTEQGYQGDDEVFALQVVQGRVSTAYTFEDLIYEPRNPRSDVRACGYGVAETELLIRVVTGFLNAMTYNIKGFDSNAIPKGILHLSGAYSPADIAAFKQYWNSTVRGINNAWSMPVMVSKDQESRAGFEKFGVEFDEMYFSKWMTFLTSIICAVYGMSPAEINFDSFTSGSSSALSGSDTGEKLAASKDSGLRPLLSYLEGLMTDFIISDFSDKFVFRWTGLDPEDADKKHEIRKSVLTVNEIRAEEGYEPMEGPLGDAPLNPSLIGPWMQMQQGQQGEGAPDGGETPDGTDGGDFGSGDSGDFGQEEASPEPDGQEGQQPEDGGPAPVSADFGKQEHEDFGKAFGLPPVWRVGD